MLVLLLALVCITFTVTEKQYAKYKNVRSVPLGKYGGNTRHLSMNFRKVNKSFLPTENPLNKVAF